MRVLDRGPGIYVRRISGKLYSDVFKKVIGPKIKSPREGVVTDENRTIEGETKWTN